MKAICLIIICLFWVESCYSQKHKGFLPENCSYTVLSQPSRTTKNAQMACGNNFSFPFLHADGTMILLSSDEIKEPIMFTLPNEIKDCESFLFINSLLICKCEEKVNSFDGEEIDNLITLSNKQFKLFPSNNGFFYLVEQNKSISSVHLINATTGEYLKLFDAPFLIDNIVGTGVESYITSDEMIYFVSKEICTLVEVADSRVQSIDFYSDGVFYSTKNACYYLGYPGKSYPFLLGDIKQVMFVDNKLYLLFSDGLLSVIDNADQYQFFLDEVMDEVDKVK